MSRVHKSGSKRKANSEEGEHLLKDHESEGNEDFEKQRQLNAQRQRRVSRWAPPAVSTVFEDVPVFTVCPYCCEKVVTKTHFKRGKKNW